MDSLEGRLASLDVVADSMARAQGGDATYDADDNSFVVTLPLAPEELQVGAGEFDDNEA